MKSRGYFDKLQFPSVFNIRTSAASLFTANWSSRLHSWCRTCPIQRPIFLSSLLTLSGEELGLQNLCFTIFVRYIIKSIQYLTLKHLCYNLVWCQMAISGKVEHRVKFAFEEQSLCFFYFQTCMGKDITLHVSANNPAVLLYQKFGFKVEEYVHNFYDKFLPPNSSECKHALFLRLSR